MMALRQPYASMVFAWWMQRPRHLALVSLPMTQPALGFEPCLLSSYRWKS